MNSNNFQDNGKSICRDYYKTTTQLLGRLETPSYLFVNLPNYSKKKWKTSTFLSSQHQNLIMKSRKVPTKSIGNVMSNLSRLYIGAHKINSRTFNVKK